SSIGIKPSYGLQEGEVERMLPESHVTAERDKALRSLRERQVEAQQHLEALESALADDGERLLSAEERVSLERGMDVLRVALQGEDADRLAALTQDLSELSSDFAARLMDAGLRQALAGHTLDELGK